MEPGSTGKAKLFSVNWIIAELTHLCKLSNALSRNFELSYLCVFRGVARALAPLARGSGRPYARMWAGSPQNLFVFRCGEQLASSIYQKFKWTHTCYYGTKIQNKRLSGNQVSHKKIARNGWYNKYIGISTAYMHVSRLHSASKRYAAVRAPSVSQFDLSCAPY